jgi:hypothetical protein
MTEKLNCEWCGDEFDIADLKQVQTDEDAQGNPVMITACLACLNAPTQQDRAREEIRYGDYTAEGWSCSYCGADYGASGGYCYKSADGNHWYEAGL